MLHENEKRETSAEFFLWDKTNIMKPKKMKDRQRRNPNKWGEEDLRSNPSEVQTALRGAMALRRRDQARRTS